MTDLILVEEELVAKAIEESVIANRFLCCSIIILIRVLSQTRQPENALTLSREQYIPANVMEWIYAHRNEIDVRYSMDVKDA